MSSANNANVYGGDEINAVVLDAGSYSTRIGYAGDDFPKLIVPSAYASSDGAKLFDSALDYPKPGREIIPLLHESLVDDWDGAVAQYRHYFDTVLALDYSEQPVLITEPVWAPKEYRQKLVETFYEEFNFPALYLAKSPTCVSFQQGRLNCLVVDIGHDAVSVVPVVDGICLLKNSMKTNYAGRYLNDLIADRLRTKYPLVDLVPRFEVKDKTPVPATEAARFTARDLPEGITTLFYDYQQQKIFSEYKELMLEVPEKKVAGSASAKELYDTEANARTMELPSGQQVEACMERYELADALFDPGSYEFSSSELAERYPPNNGELDISSPYDDYRPLKRARKAESGPLTPTPAPENGGKTVRGLGQLISHTISSVDIDLRTLIAHNIIVTGGVSLIPQLTERLNAELLSANPGLKIRLHAIGNANERTNQAWIGGSVLASLGTFHQMWVSKAEYEEAGADRILVQRFR